MNMNSSRTSDTKCIIGQGSFGKVYKYCYNNEQYALKKIYKDTKNHPELIERIEAEGKAMQLVANHRNIVGYIGEMTKGKFLYLLTQFVPNGDLRRINFLPSQDDLWEIVMQMGMALLHLKNNNLIHRDIKPENILIKSISHHGQQAQVVLKLADFGLAQVIKEGQLLQGIAGSPIYLAPQMCNQDLYSFEVDIWSLGITLYQLLNKQASPYHDEIIDFLAANPNHSQKQLFNFLISQILTKNIKCTSAFPQINNLVDQMLSKDPKKRPTPLQILQHPKVLQRIKKFNQCMRNNMELGKTISMSTKAPQCISQQQMQQQQRNTDPAGNIRNSKSPHTPNFNMNLNLNKNSQEQDRQLLYSPSINSLQLYLSSRMSNSIISQLNSSLFVHHGGQTVQNQNENSNKRNKTVKMQSYYNQQVV